jgi:hypothetical protein
VAPLVSAIIPTYNRAGYVGRAIESALDQGANVEVIVVDDDSTDNTRDVVGSYSKVRYIHQPNRKEGAARNTGAAAAQGEYFAFLDSDDYWQPGKLDADLERFEQPDRPALVYSRALNVDEHDRPLGIRRLQTPQGDVFWALAREAFMPMSTVAVRADAFRACGGFNGDPRLSGTADWELWMRFAARWPVGFVDLDKTRTCIRVHASSMLADPRYMEPAMLAGVDYALADPIVSRRVGGRAGFVRACMYVTLALHAYRHRRRARSLMWLARALGAWPAQLGDPRFIGALGRVLLGRSLVTALRRKPAIA